MKTPILVKFILIGLLASLVLPIAVTAGESTTIRGKIVERKYLNEKVIEKTGDFPIDQADPRANGESDFVLETDDNTYFYLPNVPRTLKTTVGPSMVEVTGQVFPQYQSLVAEKIRENNKLLWCKREMIWNDNTIYPGAYPDLCGK